MKNIILPQGKPLPFYLAAEEWAAMHLPAGEYFFTWVVEPTVIFGRNQDIDTEVNLDYCRSHGIAVCRRRSGGGCVYADRHNIMMSYICSDTEVSSTFAAFSSRVAAMLQAIGIEAEASGRNDVIIHGRKVSGAAFYHLPGRSIVHATMLYSTNIAHMLNAITPSRSKLESKQVQSVAAHITTVSQHCNMAMDSFHRHIIQYMCGGDDTVAPTAAGLAKISGLEQRYHDPAWLRGRSQGGSHRQRIDGVGEFSIKVSCRSGLIDSVDFRGDYFAIDNGDSRLAALLVGCPAEHKAISEILAQCDCNRLIAGLDSATLADMITQACPTN